ncbi:MAG TPA: MerR family transcriptional regulator [Thermoanaerobaculia bacterium]|jgi:DNA-binding transcriptional MerR regulator|nr:MerR family transcriptional regulator [Thermoanaerobaculia bacterium]
MAADPTTPLRAGALAALAGVSTDTLRHYERKGVLPSPRRLTNGYRSYPPEALPRVRTIRAALALGFTLDELAPLFQARQRGRPPCRAVRELAAGKLAAAEAQLAELERLVDTLRTLLASWDSRLQATPPGQPARLLEQLPRELPSRQSPRLPRHPATRPSRRKGEP